MLITKLSHISLEGKVSFKSIYSHVKQNVLDSLKNLQIDRIPVYLLHSASDMQGYGGRIIESCQVLKSEGLVGLLGVSVYSPQEVESVLELGVIDAIQIPLNVFDHRLLQTGLLDKLKESR